MIVAIKVDLEVLVTELFAIQPACAGLGSPSDESAEAAMRELLLNSRSRRFNPTLAISVLVSDLFIVFSLLMTRSLFVMHLKADMVC